MRLGDTDMGGSEVFGADRGIYIVRSVTGGVELWSHRYGESSELTRLLTRPSWPSPRQVATAGPRVFFVLDDPAFGRELWVSDGRVDGTKRLKDIRPGSSSSSAQELTAVGDLLYFAANDGEHGMEPWVSDGTPQGTRLLVDLMPGSKSSHPDLFTAAGQSLYLVGADENGDRELWRITPQTR